MTDTRIIALEYRLMALETLVLEMLYTRAGEANVTPGSEGEFQKLKQAEQRYEREFKAAIKLKARGDKA